MLRPRHIGLIGLLVLLLVVVFVVKPVSSGGGGGSSISGKNNNTPVVTTVVAINCLDNSILCANGGSGELDLTVPTATPQPAPTLANAYRFITQDGTPVPTQRDTLDLNGSITCVDFIAEPSTLCTVWTPVPATPQPTPTVVPTATPQPTATPSAGGSNNLFAQHRLANDVTESHYFVGCVQNCRVSIGQTNTGISTDILVAVPFFVAVESDLAEINIEVSTAGSAGEDARIGIYDDTGDIAPNNLIADGGSFAVDSTGFKEIAITPVTLSANSWYWVAFVTESSTVRFTAINNDAIYSMPLGTIISQINRLNWAWSANHTCGSGCGTSLPDPFPTTGETILNTIGSGSMVAITIELD